MLLWSFFALLKIICVFLCCTCLQNIAFQMTWLFIFFVCFVWFLNFIFRSDSCLFPLSLSVIVLFFVFFRCRSNTEISKNVQDTPGQCPPSMDTTDACSLFPRNVNYLTVRPPLDCGLKKSDLGESPFLHDWPPIRLILIWPEMTSRPTKLSTTSPWRLWFLNLYLWVHSN